MPATYENIATTTLGSAAQVTFTSIPATYTDLIIIGVQKDALYANNDVYLKLNSDTGTNYSVTTLFGNGSTEQSGRRTSTTDGILIGRNGNVEWQMFETHIFSYAGSTNKTALSRWAKDLNGSGEVGNSVGLWRSTAAITSITLLSGSGNFATNSTFTLYGIKSA